MLGQVIQVVARLKSCPLVVIGRYNADRAVIEIHVVILIDQAHVVSSVCEGVGKDEIDIA